jgi:D-arabinose 1-dehydrogenase-like Zn-dependent alcohol dehydrogenase
MRRVVVQSNGAVELEQAPVPSPGADEVLVSMLVSGVCGSDTHAAHGMHPFINLPYHPGHEVVGVIEAVGVEVTSVRPAISTIAPSPFLGPALLAFLCWQRSATTAPDGW